MLVVVSPGGHSIERALHFEDQFDVLMILNDTACGSNWSWLFPQMSPCNVVDTTLVRSSSMMQEGCGVLRHAQPCWLYANDDHDDDDVVLSSRCLVSSFRRNSSCHVSLCLVVCSSCLSLLTTPVYWCGCWRCLLRGLHPAPPSWFLTRV